MSGAFIRDVWRYRDVAANKSRLFSGKLMLFYGRLEMNVGLQKCIRRMHKFGVSISLRHKL